MAAPRCLAGFPHHEAGFHWRSEALRHIETGSHSTTGRKPGDMKGHHDSLEQPGRRRLDGAARPGNPSGRVKVATRPSAALRWAAIALQLALSCIEAAAIEPFEPGSLVMVRFDGGDARVVRHGEIVEECNGPFDVDTVHGIAATPDGFVLESFRDGEPDYRSTIAARGRGCTREVRANFALRQLEAIAFDPQGRVWANDSLESELVRLDLERGVVDRAFPIPVDHVLGDIGIDGTFYLRASGQNVLPVSPDGEMLPRWSVPASRIVVAPDGNVLVGTGLLREFSPSGDLIHVIIGPEDPYVGLTPFALESADVLWHLGSNRLDYDITLLVRRSRSGQILRVDAMEAYPGFNFLTHVPSARFSAARNPTATPTASPSPIATPPPTPSSTAQIGASGCQVGPGSPVGPGLLLMLLALHVLSRSRRRRAAMPNREAATAISGHVRALLLTAALVGPLSLAEPALSHAQPTIIGVTNDRVVELDPESGTVIREIARMPIFGRPPALVSDGSRVFVVTAGAAMIVSVDIASGESREIPTPCCLAGSAGVVGNQLHVLVEDRGAVSLVTLDADTGEEQTFIRLPNGIEAVTLFSAETEPPSPTATGTPNGVTPTNVSTPRPVGTRTATATPNAARSNTPEPTAPFTATSTEALAASRSSGCRLRHDDAKSRESFLLALVIPLLIGSARRRALRAARERRAGSRRDE